MPGIYTTLGILEGIKTNKLFPDRFKLIQKLAEDRGQNDPIYLGELLLSNGTHDVAWIINHNGFVPYKDIAGLYMIFCHLHAIPKDERQNLVSLDIPVKPALLAEIDDDLSCIAHDYYSGDLTMSGIADGSGSDETDQLIVKIRIAASLGFDVRKDKELFEAMLRDRR